jgi:hypothetical protein
MMTIQFKSCWQVGIFILCLQSLADVARQEAERRRLLDQQGIEAKVIDGTKIPAGNVSTSADVNKTSKGTSSVKDKKSLQSIRNSLEKLDRTIRQEEERLGLRRARLQSERWEALKSGRGSTGKSQSRLKEEIEELEIKLRSLRDQRSKIYERGKKDGFLPGELDGKGIIP